MVAIMGGRKFLGGRCLGAVWLALCLALAGVCTASATQTIRVVAYNIEADVDGNTVPNSGLYTVLEAIGENYVNGAAHPLDILTLEETTSNTATVAPMVTALNSYYGSGVYAMSSLQGTESGGDPSTGNGPNALVYNTKTVTLLASAGIGTPTGSTNGEYRQVMRYEFMPVGGATGTQFYVYVSHMKSSSSGTTANDQKYRGEEATIIVNDIKALSANGGVLVMGDFNLDGSTEAAYKTLTATGTYQLIDPLNASNNYNETWDSSTYLTLLTESSTALDYRDDIQFLSAAVYNGTSTTGLHYVAGSFNIFGNNGSVAYGKSVGLSTNTALNGLQGSITPASARSALTTASDHLPVVADYTVVAPTPYSTWQSKYFTSAQLANAAVSGNAADPDGDGIPNLLEYALNLSPTTPGVIGLPTVGKIVVSGNSYQTLTFTKVIANTDITYVPQVSPDLVTWNSGASYVATVGTTNNADGVTQTVVVRDLTPITGEAQRFIRLAVTMP